MHCNPQLSQFLLQRTAQQVQLSRTKGRQLGIWGEMLGAVKNCFCLMSNKPSSSPPQLKSQGRKANTEQGYCVTAQFACDAFSYSLTSTHINQTIKERQTPLFPPPYQETNEANDRFRTIKITQEMHPTTDNSSMAPHSVMDPGYCHGATEIPNTHSWSQSFIWKFPYCNVARSSTASDAQKKNTHHKTPVSCHVKHLT